MTDRIKQFSYDPLKSIVKFTGLEKREQLSKCIFSLKRIDAVVPYQFETLGVDSTFIDFSFGKRTRAIQLGPMNPEEPDALYREEDAEKYTGCHISMYVCKKPRHFKRNERLEEVMLKFLKEYLKKGTKVARLQCYGVSPNFVELGKDRWKVKKLGFQCVTPNTLHSWLDLVSDEGPFEAVKFVVCAETMYMFREPRIQSCTRFELRFPFVDTIPLEGWFVNLQNRHIDVIHPQFPMEIIKVMIRKWVNWRRPLGTSFSLGIQYYTTVLDAFDMAQAELNGKLSNFPEITNSYCTHCCTIPVDDQLEVVIFGGRRPKRWLPFVWDLKVEVMKKGRTVPKQ